MTFITLVVTLAVAIGSSARERQPPVEVSYPRDIEPIFKANCTICHGSTGDRMGGLSLDTYDEMMKGGAHGYAIVAGDSAQSRLVLMIEGAIEPRMPLGGELKPGEIKLIKTWVDRGAPRAVTGRTEPSGKTGSSAAAATLPA